MNNIWTCVGFNSGGIPWDFIKKTVGFYTAIWYHLSWKHVKNDIPSFRGFSIISKNSMRIYPDKKKHVLYVCICMYMYVYIGIYDRDRKG